MNKIGLFYGSTSGNTKFVAEAIASAIGAENVDIHDVANASAKDMAGYDSLILGVSTWGLGELQDDMIGFAEDMEGVDMSGKKVAVFGLGDQMTYGETFVDGIGVLAKNAVKNGATLVGRWPTDGYDFVESAAVEGNEFLGLAVDEDNQNDQTESRIHAWIEKIKPELT